MENIQVMVGKIDDAIHETVTNLNLSLRITEDHIESVALNIVIEALNGLSEELRKVT